jgi:hypothetical protein
VPVDANIPLSVQTPQMPDLLAQYGRAVQLQSALQGQQLQQAQLTGINQENQIRQRQMDELQKTNEIYRNSFTQPTDGSAPQLDPNKLTKSMAEQGLGSRIPEAMQHYTEYQKSLTDLGNAQSELSARQKDAGGMLGLASRKAQYEPNLFLTGLQDGINSHALNAQQTAPVIQKIHETLQQDPTGAAATKLVKTYAESMIAGSPKASAQLDSDARANALEDRTRNAEQRTADAEDKLKTGTWQRTGDVTPDGYAIYWNPQTKESYVDRATKVAMSGSGAGAGGVSPTRQAILNAQSSSAANQAEREETKWDNLRKQVGNALTDGGQFVEVDRSGNVKTTSFDKLVPKGKDEAAEDYATRRTKAIVGYQKQMHATLEMATTAANQATARKNNAILAVDPNAPIMPTAQAVAGRGGPQTPAAPAQAPAAPAQAQQPKIFPTDPTRKSKFTVGQTLYTPSGQPIKVKGFTQDGKVIPQ